MTNPDITREGVALALGFSRENASQDGRRIFDAALSYIESIEANHKYARESFDFMARLQKQELDQMQKACAEWADVSQKNYQRAKSAEARVAELEADLRFQKTATEIMQNALVALSQCDHAVSAAEYASDALGAVEAINQEGR